MRLPIIRLAALVASIVVVVSCDSGPTTSTKFGNGIAAGPTGTAPIVPPAPGSIDSNRPFVCIDTPAAPPGGRLCPGGTTRPDTSLINVGDSIRVVSFIHDDRALKSLSVTGYKIIGDPNLGTLQRIQRYPTIDIPVQNSKFRPGLTDTTIRRDLQPASPVDTTTGLVFIEAIVVDSSGNADTTTRVIRLVTGPKVQITSPIGGDSVPRNVAMLITTHLQHGEGVARCTIFVKPPTSWPTRLTDSIIVKVFATPPTDTTFDTTVFIPADAVLRSKLRIDAKAIDIRNNPGQAPAVQVFIRETGTLPPLVRQGSGNPRVVPNKLEYGDSIEVQASGEGITKLGIVVKDLNGNVIAGAGETLTVTPVTSNVTKWVHLNLDTFPNQGGLQFQGQTVRIYSFAIDNGTPTPKVGFSVRPGNNTPQTAEVLAATDNVLITYGRTFKPPRLSVYGDIAVDETAGRVFVSNTAFNLLEMWTDSNITASGARRATNQRFLSSGIQVGAQPWGLFVSNDPNVLLVGNSGATTISRVCIGTCAGVTTLSEDLRVVPATPVGRIRTREIIDYSVSFALSATGRITMTVIDSAIYSDRPQYVAQGKGGKIFYSTKPTNTARPGTIRYLDPALPYPDNRQIWQYGAVVSGEAIIYGILHADSIRIGKTLPTSGKSDTLFIFDHPYGEIGAGGINGAALSASDSFPTVVVSLMNAQGSDVEAVLGLDLKTLALTDTTFVGTSGDRKWIGFGEGNTTADKAGRLMMTHDPTLPVGSCSGLVAPFTNIFTKPNCAPDLFSPNITVTDITHNASEKVFGIGVDSAGNQIVSHGFQTYMASVDFPFHLRLDGVYDSFDNGAGVAYHPRANSTGTTDTDNRVAFSATASGLIEIIDVAHYNNRATKGSLTTKANLYGALRATTPLPGDNLGLTCLPTRAGSDPNCIVLKLYGLSSNGLIVVDLRWSDITQVP